MYVFFLFPIYFPSSLWNYHTVHGYTLVYIINLLRMFTLCFTTIGIDTLYSWLMSNIVAQFRILTHRFQQAAWATAALDGGEISISEEQQRLINDCIRFHNRTLDLVKELNRVYGSITFVKFVVSSIQICCSVFYVSSSDAKNSAFNLFYQSLFLAAVSLQLATYCYNAQRITDEVSWGGELNKGFLSMERKIRKLGVSKINWLLWKRNSKIGLEM